MHERRSSRAILKYVLEVMPPALLCALALAMPRGARAGDLGSDTFRPGPGALFADDASSHERPEPDAPRVEPGASVEQSGSGPSRDWMHLLQGVACGEVTTSTALIWARASVPSLVHVECATDPAFAHRLPAPAPVRSLESDDNTVVVPLTGLGPDTAYYYRVWLTDDAHPELTSDRHVGKFRTAPDPIAPAPVTLVWAGGLGGDERCRRAGHGYTVFKEMEALAPDFYIGAGDMIYADGDCPRGGPDGAGDWQNEEGDFPSVTETAVSWDDAAGLRDVFRRHWRYNRADPHLQRFLAGTAFYPQWDDHEVVGGFGAGWSYWNAATRDRSGYATLVGEGGAAFREYAPIARTGNDAPIYRSYRWGRDVEIFLLDPRSYRSRDDELDLPSAGKTMLGAEQLEWLRNGLTQSTATWKIVSSVVPLTIPTGDDATGRDGWASGEVETGYERELSDLLASLDHAGVRNLVFLSSDAGWPAEIRCRKDFDGDGTPLTFHELSSPQLSAAEAAPVPLDPSLAPQLLWSAKGLGFGVLRAQAGTNGPSHLVVEMRGENGKPLAGSTLDLTAE